MKTLKMFSAIIVVAAFGLFSCSSSLENDAQKVADLQCKAQQLMGKAATGDLSVVSEGTALMTEASELTNEMQSKYSSDEDKAKFAEALLKAIGNCK